MNIYIFTTYEVNAYDSFLRIYLYTTSYYKVVLVIIKPCCNPQISVRSLSYANLGAGHRV